MTPSWGVLAVAAFMAAALTPVTIKALKSRRILDVPNARSSHAVATPRGAGIAQVPAMIAAFLVGAPVPLAAWLSVVGFAGIGVVDDIRSMDARIRLALQTLVAVVASFSLVLATSQSLPLMLVSAIAAGAVMVAIVNATNFMDGINGISVIHGVIFGSAYSVVFWRVDLREWMFVGLALIGVSLALVPWNWGRNAWVFLGDSGSYLLGGTVGMLGMAAWLIGPGIIVAFAPLTIYLTDTGATLVHRARRRESLMTAHRRHVYQRLANGGWSHPRTASVVAIFSACATAVGFLVLFDLVSAALAGLMLGVLSSAYLLLPRLVDGCTGQASPQDSESEST